MEPVSTPTLLLDRDGALIVEPDHSLSDALGATLRPSVDGENAHHIMEARFKDVGRALRQGFPREGMQLPTTKGVL